MKFVAGCNLEEFKRYIKRIGLYKGAGQLDELERMLKNRLLNLIVWRENGEIIGHAIWHETNTEEHRKGDPRDKEDKEALERLLGGKKDFVELHEIWLMKEHRGKGYGKKFFGFFEEFMRKRGFDSIVYYANHPAAVHICRNRGCKEEYLKQIGEYVFYIRLN